MPEDLYNEEESTFFRLIYNTVKDLSPFEIKSRPCDDIIHGCLGSCPSYKNLKLFFGSEVIRGLWTNAWNAKVTSFYESKMMKKIVRVVYKWEQE